MLPLAWTSRRWPAALNHISGVPQCVAVLQQVVYGGATGGGSLSSDELYLLDIRNEDCPISVGFGAFTILERSGELSVDVSASDGPNPWPKIWSA
eukprot:4798366-Amphidinium_carterae.1